MLGALIEGMSAEEIAEADFVALTTIRSQIRAILHKLGVRSQLAAVAQANRAGWQPPTPVRRARRGSMMVVHLLRHRLVFPTVSSILLMWFQPLLDILDSLPRLVGKQGDLKCTSGSVTSPSWRGRMKRLALLIAGAVVLFVSPAAAADAPVTPDNFEVILVVDTSGSMTGHPVEAAIGAAAAFVAQMPAGVRIGVESFGREIRVLSTPTLDRALVTQQLAGLTAGGDTPLHDAVITANRARSRRPRSTRRWCCCPTVVTRAASPAWMLRWPSSLASMSRPSR